MNFDQTIDDSLLGGLSALALITLKRSDADAITVTHSGPDENGKCWGSIAILEWREAFKFMQSKHQPQDRSVANNDGHCHPPLDCPHAELVAYIMSMKGGERVMEMGGSGMVGETGTVEIRDGRVCIRWDTVFPEGSGMVTSFTGGARIIPGTNDDQQPK